MKKINLLLLTGLVLLPAIPLSAQTFENVFLRGQVVPTFYDDVNNDGKLEYLWTKYTNISDKNEMQWLSIDGSLVMDLKTIKDNGIIASNIIVSRDLKLQKLNAEPYSGFAFYGVDSSIKGKVLIPRNGSYVYHEFDMKNTTGATWADVNLDGLEDLLYWDNIDLTLNFRKKTVRSPLSLCQ